MHIVLHMALVFKQTKRLKYIKKEKKYLIYVNLYNGNVWQKRNYKIRDNTSMCTHVTIEWIQWLLELDSYITCLHKHIWNAIWIITFVVHIKYLHTNCIIQVMYMF